jgi:hypothetical protein
MDKEQFELASRELRAWRDASIVKLAELQSRGLTRHSVAVAVFELEATVVPQSEDPLLQIRHLRDAMGAQADRLREAGKLEQSHADLHNICQQVEGLLCPPSAKHEAEVHAARERHAQHEAARITERAEQIAQDRAAKTAKA